VGRVAREGALFVNWGRGRVRVILILSEVWAYRIKYIFWQAICLVQI
jgi:hypothetical protein